MRALATIQAIYFILTGIWPILHIKSFMAVTGPKTDIWLVKTVGVLVTVIGVALAIAAARKNFSIEIFTLAVGSAAALTAIDIIYVAKKVIDRIYLLDALAEFILIAAWVALWVNR
jgi:hypothetical protein